MSKEEILEKYKNREWLYDQYIVQKKTIKQIAEEFGYSKSTVARYKDRFSIKKYKRNQNSNKYANREWLYDEYIIKNKSPIEISEECNVSRGLIFEYISKYNLIKSKDKKGEAQSKRINKISLEKYGVEHFNSAPEVINKRKETNLKRYGKESYLGSKDHRIKYEKNTFCGKSLYEWGLEKNISNIILYRWLKRNPNSTEKEFLSYIDTYAPRISNIENIVKKELSLLFYNKKFDKKKYPKLDYRPDFKISDFCALNVDGLYWHSEAHKDRLYHFNMRKEYEDRNIRLFQFRGDEINYKMNIVKSIVNNYLGKSKKIYARKTEIKNVPHKEADRFLKNNHLMGSIKAKHVGLYYEKELVTIFSYKIRCNSMKVDRFCSKEGTAVIGGFSKLLKHIIKIYNPSEIKYWVDLRYGTGSYLEKFGFKHIRDTLGWRWTNFENTYNRLRCRANMDDRNFSERLHSEELGWYKIYDAGQRLYILSK